MSHECRCQSWGCWFKDNSDKFLLAAITLSCYMGVLHMTHEKVDIDNIHWAREITGEVLGALLGLVTGVRIGQAMSQTSYNRIDPDGTKTSSDKVIETTGGNVRQDLPINTVGNSPSIQVKTIDPTSIVQPETTPEDTK